MTDMIITFPELNTLGDIVRELSEGKSKYSSSYDAEFLKDCYESLEENILLAKSVGICRVQQEMLSEMHQDYESQARLLVYEWSDLSYGKRKQLVDANDKSWVKELDFWKPVFYHSRLSALNIFDSYVRTLK